MVTLDSSGLEGLSSTWMNASTKWHKTDSIKNNSEAKKEIHVLDAVIDSDNQGETELLHHNGVKEKNYAGIFGDLLEDHLILLSCD